MNSWLESLEDCLEKQYLNQFDEIYYLNSKLVCSKDHLDQIVNDKKLFDYLKKPETEADDDVLDFFLLVNDNQQDIVVLLSPFDLMEDESIFKVYGNIEEDFSNLPTIEMVK